jgi:hypothetical protein
VREGGGGERQRGTYSLREIVIEKRERERERPESEGYKGVDSTRLASEAGLEGRISFADTAILGLGRVVDTVT